MRRRLSLVIGLLVAALHAPALVAQQPPAAARAAAPSPTQVSAILVDVVVRDRKGDPVAGLTAEDFEIAEDGVVQTLGSLTPVFKSAPAPVAASAPVTVPATGASTPAAVAPPAAPKVAAAQEAPEVIALVFDRLTADGRALAHTASMKYLGATEGNARHYMGVYSIDVSLTTLQNFTRDMALIRKAVDEFAKHAARSSGRTPSRVTTTRRP